MTLLSVLIPRPTGILVEISGKSYGENKNIGAACCSINDQVIWDQDCDLEAAECKEENIIMMFVFFYCL